jgi:repressor LexA
VDASPLTPVQRAVVGYFHELTERGLPPPTYREICRRFGWSSSRAAGQVVEALVRKGALRHVGGRGRAYCLAGAPVAVRLVPVVGTVAAGRPILAEENRAGDVAVPASWARGEAFALNVVGDSMVGAGILDGDTVIARRAADAEHGDVVVARIGENATVKRLHRQGRSVRLVAANAAYEPIPVDDDTEVLGVVVGLMREVGRRHHHARVR